MDSLPGFTPVELANLRVRCVEVFVNTASRIGIEKGEVFNLGQKLFEFATQTTEQKPAGKTQAGKAPAGK